MIETDNCVLKVSNEDENTVMDSHIDRGAWIK